MGIFQSLNSRRNSGVHPASVVNGGPGCGSASILPARGRYLFTIREQSLPVAVDYPKGFRDSVLALGPWHPDLPHRTGDWRPSHEGHPHALRVRPAATALPNSPWEATEPPVVRGPRRGSGAVDRLIASGCPTITAADPQVHVTRTALGARSVPMVSPGSTDPRGGSAPRLSHLLRTPPSGTPSPKSVWAVGDCHHRTGHDLAVSATRSAAESGPRHRCRNRESHIAQMPVSSLLRLISARDQLEAGTEGRLQGVHALDELALEGSHRKLQEGRIETMQPPLRSRCHGSGRVCKNRP